MSFPGTEEDSIIMNRGAIQRGLFRMVKTFTVTGSIKISDPVIKSYYGRPPLKPGESADVYRNLNEHGLPIIGSYMKEFDCVIGIVKEKNGIKYNDSVYLQNSEKGIVDDVVFYETDTFETIIVKLRITRAPENGDKYAARFSQKGTILIVDEDQMPFSEKTGTVLDIIINPTVIPSRMTVSYLFEIITGKAAACCGQTVDASAFEDIDMDKWKHILIQNGFNREGYERLRDGRTGKLIETDIFVGVAYFQALKHQPQDKIGVRSQGSLCADTRAPVKGRHRGGGLRYGTMESDCTLAHGAVFSVKERLCDVSDKYTMAMCKTCGVPAEYSDTRQEFACPLCSKRNVGALTMPYASKFKTHIMGLMGIKIAPGFLEGGLKMATGKNIRVVEEDEDIEEKEAGEEGEEEEEELEDYQEGYSEESEDIDDEVEIDDEIFDNDDASY
jgi:DNA-directed RNA polymerase beta subunit